MVPMVWVGAVPATYLHQLDPVALHLFGNFSLKWYGLAYLLGFVCGFLLLRRLARRGLWVLPPEQAGDFIAAAALFGVFVGGRLGYLLFYQIPETGWRALLADPLIVLRVWEGGMASHGGILGLMVFTWFYARKHRVTWTGLGDGLCVVAPLGLLFGRIANFINGELYGRVASDLRWAVRFPDALRREPAEVQAAAWQSCTAIEPRLAEADSMQALATAVRDNPRVAEALGPYLQPRHPSQLYEAALEGLLLFAILWTVRTRFRNAPDGLMTGLFFVCYAVFRVFGEQFREPDAALAGPFTRGQFLSLFMVAIGAAFLVHAWRGWKRRVS